MRKNFLYYTLSGLSLLLTLRPGSAAADFIVEFTDGRQITVSSYTDEGRTIKIYTSYGALGFRKDDIRRITEVSANQSKDLPLDSAIVRPSFPEQGPVVESTDKKETDGTSGHAKMDSGKQKATEERELTEADLEQLDARYQGASEQYGEAWKKHRQDFRAGASAEVLAENRKKLLELDHQRKSLRKEVRQVDPEKLLEWAQ